MTSRIKEGPGGEIRFNVAPDMPGGLWRPLVSVATEYLTLTEALLLQTILLSSLRSTEKLITKAFEDTLNRPPADPEAPKGPVN